MADSPAGEVAEGAERAVPDTNTERPPRSRSTQAGRGRIGLIVAGSLILGFLASIVLDVGVFGGAEEHVIMGMALLGWSIGWASLAVLSTRLTDQPQRWALVPAAVMALAGAGLLIFRPDTNAFNALGWIWPPAFIALAVWMAIQARAQLRSIARRLLLYPLFAALVIAGVAGGYETIQERIDQSSIAMPGQLVDVGGRRLHINCTGTGSPTVVLVSGLGETSAYWGGWIQPAVEKSTTVCAYDRAGQGWSDPPTTPQDGAAVATDLHALLDRAQLPGPYVLVGHSTGGVYARIFTAHYPDQVAGMVFLDSQPNEAMSGGLPDYPSTYSLLRRATAIFPPLARVGVFRLINQLPPPDALPAAARDAERATTTTGSVMRIQRDEFAMLPKTLEEAAALRTIGDMPLIVVSALLGQQAGWIPMQDRMVTLSTNSVHRAVSTDHAGVVHDPIGAATSSQAILDVVGAVRNGTPLPKS